MKIPAWANTAMDWAAGHRWLIATLTVAAASFLLVFWLPAFAGLPLGVFTGICIGLAAGRDRRLVLESLHDKDQITIGGLRAEISKLNARPAAEAATKAIAYIPDNDERGKRQ